jgi:RNA polymerase sigma-70 factor (ECF subfamily)
MALSFVGDEACLERPEIRHPRPALAHWMAWRGAAFRPCWQQGCRFELHGNAGRGTSIQCLQEAHMPHHPNLSRSPVATDAPDLELAFRAAAGDEPAFEAIMRRHNRLLFRSARAIVKSDMDAEDAVQQAYLQAWQALGNFRADAKLSTWLVRIVVNEALGQLRRRQLKLVPLESAMAETEPLDAPWQQDDHNHGPDRKAMRSELRQIMEARIDMLPDDFRRVFMLRGVEEMSVEEVSQALDIPETTVRTRFFRARSLLREGLSQDLDMALSDAFHFDGERCNRIVASVWARLAPR